MNPGPESRYLPPLVTPAEKIRQIEMKLGQNNQSEVLNGQTPYAKAFSLFKRFFSLQSTAAEHGLDLQTSHNQTQYEELHGSFINLEFGHQVGISLTESGTITVFGQYHDRITPLLMSPARVRD